MTLLLDTHVAIWASMNKDRLPVHIQETIEANAGHVFVSVVSIWEIAIKHQLGRVEAPPFSGQQAIVEFGITGFDLLDVRPDHAAFVERLPLLHGDPFDRLMLAQAIIEGHQFVTHDRMLARYDAGILTW